MRDVITMWRHTRMVVLVPLIAAVYAAVLIPFKVALPIVPGFTEFRPANVIPIVCSLLFGPAAAWGAAIGNLIADMFGGTFGPGSFFGFIGNFLYGLLPYKLWGRMGALSAHAEPGIGSARQAVEFVLVTLAACFACAVIVGWGVDILGFLPFSFIANVVFINNLAVTLVLGPPLLAAVAPRVRRWGLRYSDILDDDERRPGRLSVLGVALVWAGAALGFVVGNSVGLGLGAPFLAPGDVVGQLSLSVSVGVPVAALILGCLLL